MLFGEYKILSQLATGGMSEVFLAQRANTSTGGEYVVIKKILPVLAKDRHFVELFKEEARISRMMNHPNVVQILDSGEVDNQPFIAMEHVDGIDCWRMIHRCSAQGSPPPPRACVFVVSETLRALHHVHTATDEYGRPMNVVHGDVSPTNIYISRSGQVKLGDFGIARAKHRDLSNAKSSLRGKVAYMAPEQVMGTEDVDHRADIFSAGTVLTELLIQTRLFGGGSQLTTLLTIRDARLDVLESNLSKLPDGLEMILRRALARDRRNRFPTAMSMYQTLQWFVDSTTPERLRAELAQLVEIACATTSTYPDSGIPLAHPLSRRRVELDMDAAPKARSTEKPTRNSNVPRLDSPELDSGWVDDDGPTISTKSPFLSRGSEVPPAYPKAHSTIPPLVPPEIGRVADDEQLVQEELEIDIELDFEDAKDSVQSPAPATPMYTFRRADGSILGPMTRVAAIEQVIADQIRSHYEVSFSGGPFRPLAEVRELARHAPSLTPITTEFASIGPPDRRGLITAEDPVWRILFELSQAQETGLMIFDQEVVRKEVYIKDGKLHYVTSNVSSELLGKSLVEKGVISPDELDLALQQLSQYNNHLGDALIGMQMLEPVTLFRYIQSQVKDKLLDIFSWRHGEYMLYRGVEDPDAAFPLHISIHSILWTGIKNGVSDAEAKRWLKKHEIMTVAPVDYSPIELEELSLPEAVMSVLALITRPMSVSLAKNMSGDREVELDVIRSLILATDIGLLELLEQAPRSSKPSELGNI